MNPDIGVTASEIYLNKLAVKTFLSLWSYPRPFRNQDRGKELCDLLVVFDNHVIIFSDKDIALSASENDQVAWSRWFKRAVWNSAEQIWGAERWIKEHPDRIFLDSECTKPFPIAFPNPDSIRFHRIAVAHGASKRIQERFGGSGSLMLRTDLRGKDAHISATLGAQPSYAVGHLDVKKGFVHVFDDVSLDIVMQTLDTVTDFVNYLQKKEALISSDTIIMAAGEEEILADYLRNLNEKGEHDFVLPEGEDVVIYDEGFYEQFSRSLPRRAQIHANDISYAWDEIIERFNFHLLDGSQYFTSISSFDEHERIRRFLARESRLNRRTLSRALVDLVLRTPPNYRAVRVIPSSKGGSTYVFMVVPHLSGKPYDEYRLVRRHFLHAAMMVTRHQFPEVLDIIGIATEPRDVIERSEDLLYLDGREWSYELDIEAQRIQRELHLLTNVRPFRVREEEYPQFDADILEKYKRGKIPRNAQCPCGSGKKYKKCCGRADVRNGHREKY